MTDTFWLAIYKNGKAALGKIALGEFRGNSKYIRIITSRETILGDLGDLYKLGQGTTAEGNNVLYETKKAALLHLRGLAEKYTKKCVQEIVDARAQERKLRVMIAKSEE